MTVPIQTADILASEATALPTEPQPLLSRLLLQSLNWVFVKRVTAIVSMQLIESIT